MNEDEKKIQTEETTESVVDDLLEKFIKLTKVDEE